MKPTVLKKWGLWLVRVGPDQYWIVDTWREAIGLAIRCARRLQELGHV